MASYSRPLVIPSTANGGLVISRSARFYLIVAASENLIITGFKGSSQVVDVQGMGAGWGDWVGGDGFDRLVITTASGNAGTITIALGDDYANYTTLTSTVMVQDTSSGIYNALNGFAFMGNWSQAAGGVGTQAFAKLRNPAASGINLYIKRVRTFSAAGAVNQGYWYSNDVTDKANISANIGCKLVGSALVPKAVLSFAAPAGIDAGATEFGLDTLQVGVQGALDLNNSEIIVKPGWAFYVMANSANTDLKGMIEWLER